MIVRIASSIPPSPWACHSTISPATILHRLSRLRSVARESCHLAQSIWLTKSGAQSAPDLIRPSQSHEDQNSIDVPARHRPDKARGVEAEVLSVRMQGAHRARQSRNRQPIRPLLQVQPLYPNSHDPVKAKQVSTAAAAAKINAELQARKGIQHVDVPPIRSVGQA